MGCVVDCVMFLQADGSIPGEGVMWTVPMILKCWGTFLEDLTAALWAEDVVAQTEVLV